jgi:hypothetical protein
MVQRHDGKGGMVRLVRDRVKNRWKVVDSGAHTSVEEAQVGESTVMEREFAANEVKENG